MNDNPERILNQWINSINNNNFEETVDLYNENAVLVPTFSNRFLPSRESIKDYFKRLSVYKNLSVTLHEKTLRMQRLSGETHLAMGIYCWRFMVDDELLSFEARFSFVFDLSKEKPIVHHHSSQIPRMV